MNVRLPFKNGGLAYENVTILPDLNGQLSDEQAFSQKGLGDSFSFPSLNDYLDDKNYDQSSFFDLSSVFLFSFVWGGEGEQDLDESNVYLSFSNDELLLAKRSFYTRWVFEGNLLNESEFDRLGDNRLFCLVKESRGYFSKYKYQCLPLLEGAIRVHRRLSILLMDTVRLHLLSFFLLGKRHSLTYAKWDYFSRFKTIYAFCDFPHVGFCYRSIYLCALGDALDERFVCH